MINLLILLPFLKGGTGASYPVDFLDRFITSSFTSPQKKFGFFFELPSELRFISIVHRNFSFESDGKTFLGFSYGTYAERASLSLRGKLYFLNKSLKGFATGIGYLQAPSDIFSIGFYGEGSYYPEGNRTELFVQTGFSIHKRGIALNIEPCITIDSLGFKTGLTYFKKLESKYINSIKFYTGFQVFKKMIFSLGLRIQRDNMEFLLGLYGKRIFAGFVLDFKKRIVIKEIVRTKEVPVYIEVPKKEKKEIVKKPTVKKEKIPEISEEEMEYYYKKGIEFYKMEMLEEAIKAWEKIIKVKPDYKDTKKLYEQAKERLEKLRRISE